MYEELVKRLRDISNSDSNIKSNYIGLTMIQAADAIEELSKPHWVSVNERLPKAYEEVTLRFPNNQAAGFCDRDGCWAVYSGDGFYTEVADNEPKPTHWMKKLPEPPKEKA